MESTDSEAVFREGVLVFINMQESGLLLPEEIQARLRDLGQSMDT